VSDLLVKSLFLKLLSRLFQSLFAAFFSNRFLDFRICSTNEPQYTLILPGHGKPTGRSVIDEDLKYLDVVDKVLATTNTKKEYRSKILAAYPDYAGEHLMDDTKYIGKCHGTQKKLYLQQLLHH